MEKRLLFLIGPPRSGSTLLRHFVSSRFGVDLSASTTEELATTEPVMGVRSRWPEVVRILRSLDDERFRDRSSDGATRQQRVSRALDEVERFIARWKLIRRSN